MMFGDVQVGAPGRRVIHRARTNRRATLFGGTSRTTTPRPSSASSSRPSIDAADVALAAIHTIHPIQRNGSRRTGYTRLGSRRIRIHVRPGGSRSRRDAAARVDPRRRPQWIYPKAPPKFYRDVPRTRSVSTVRSQRKLSAVNRRRCGFLEEGMVRGRFGIGEARCDALLYARLAADRSDE